MRGALIAVVLLASSPAFAATQPRDSAESSKAEKKICKRMEATESRMGSKRICRTAAEWKRASQGDGYDDRDGSVSSKVR